MSSRALFTFVCAALSGGAIAAPVDGTIKAGAATIVTAGTTTTITQTSERAVIDWRSFDIAASETVHFAQPGAQSAVLNRVTGNQFSSLQGSLTANGQVYLVNPNGILIGPTGAISASAFVASTASIADSAFMKDTAAATGRYAFNEVTSASGTGTIVNTGTISVTEGGLVALVAPAVRSTGSITARLGTIELAAASRFTLDLFGDDLVRFAIDDSLSSALTDVQGNHVSSQVDAAGHLNADGGHIVMLSVPAASGVVDQAINLSGVAQARSVSAGKLGSIELLANNGKVELGGTADVSAPEAGVIGGSITAIGTEVKAASTARVDASGAGGGGNVVLGGKYTANVTTATNLAQVDAGATVKACGTVTCAVDGSVGTGTGGNVRLFSVGGTHLSGDINVSGSAAQQAGIVEVISDTGVAELTSTAHILAISGAGQPAGFTVVIGDTLSIDPNVTIDMRDFSGGTPDGAARIISDSNPASTVRSYVRDDGIPQRQTFQSVLFHAYSSLDYVNTVPAVFDPVNNPGSHVFANGVEGPVGTLRPNGGVPSSLASSGVDTLAAIPVVFVPSAPGTPSTPGSPSTPGTPSSPSTPSLPSGSDALTAQVSEASNDVSQQSGRDGNSKASSQKGEHAASTMLTGGPGVAQSADLGRSGDAAGASPDVFGANYHVLAPTNGDGDAQVADYLCTTPYSGNACH